jgi:hypothetical protein
MTHLKVGYLINNQLISEKENAQNALLETLFSALVFYPSEDHQS